MVWALTLVFVKVSTTTVVLVIVTTTLFVENNVEFLKTTVDKMCVATGMRCIAVRLAEVLSGSAVTLGDCSKTVSEWK